MYYFFPVLPVDACSLAFGLFGEGADEFSHLFKWMVNFILFQRKFLCDRIWSFICMEVNSGCHAVLNAHSKINLMWSCRNLFPFFNFMSMSINWRNGDLLSFMLYLSKIFSSSVLLSRLCQVQLSFLLVLLICIVTFTTLIFFPLFGTPYLSHPFHLIFVNTVWNDLICIKVYPAYVVYYVTPFHVSTVLVISF